MFHSDSNSLNNLFCGSLLSEEKLDMDQKAKLSKSDIEMCPNLKGLTPDLIIWISD